MEVFNENTRSLAVVKACEHARQDMQAKHSAAAHLVRHVPPETAAQSIQHLSTPQIPISALIALEPDHNAPKVTIEFTNEG